jgi:ribonuclease R
MTKAYYDVEILWHFWLALTYYSHFTSPIRRYSDLQIHRIIKEKISWKLTEKRINHYKKILKNVAEICSEQEQFAVELERKIQDIMFAKYMEKHIWDEFEGKITWIINNGIFVELENTIEWFVYIDDKNAKFDEEMLILEIWNKKYELGKKIKVKVIWVDKLRWKIDFEEVIEE